MQKSRFPITWRCFLPFELTGNSLGFCNLPPMSLGSVETSR
jgi:hypothetical protein